MTAPWGKFDEEVSTDSVGEEGEEVVEFDLHSLTLFVAFAFVAVGLLALMTKLSQAIPR